MATLGEERVRVNFNPSGDSAIDELKQKAAELIDLVNELAPPADPAKAGEFKRLVALASTCWEDGAMWAVKAATFPAA